MILTHYNSAAYTIFGNTHYKNMHLGKSNSLMLGPYVPKLNAADKLLKAGAIKK